MKQESHIAAEYRDNYYTLTITHKPFLFSSFLSQRRFKESAELKQKVRAATEMRCDAIASWITSNAKMHCHDTGLGD
jgi:hypothetical protein